MSHAADAAEWMARHPDAFAFIERMALEAAGRGRAFGMKALAEVVRWHFRYQRDESEEWKLNNNHVTYLGRELIERHPWIAPYITIRKATGHEDSDA